MRTSMQAATNEAATSVSEKPGSARTWFTTAVLSPENEKVYPSASMGRGKPSTSSPVAARRSSTGPPGYPRPRKRATLS